MLVEVLQYLFFVLPCQNVFLEVYGLPASEYLILATDREPQKALENFLRRWEIETHFGSLKTRGLDLEGIRVVEPERIQKLVALIWPSSTVGVFLRDILWNSMEEIKTIKSSFSRTICLFRNELNEALLNISKKLRGFVEWTARFYEQLGAD